MSFVEVFEEISKSAKNAADETINQMELLKQANVIDSGAYGFSVMLEAAFNCLGIDNKGNVIGVAVANFGKEEGIESFNFGIKSSVLKTFINSFNVSYGEHNESEKSNKELGKIITESTVYIECWMTKSKIAELIKLNETQKAFFSNFID